MKYLKIIIWGLFLVGCSSHTPTSKKNAIDIKATLINTKHNQIDELKQINALKQEKLDEKKDAKFKKNHPNAKQSLFGFRIGSTISQIHNKYSSVRKASGDYITLSKSDLDLLRKNLNLSNMVVIHAVRLYFSNQITTWRHTTATTHIGDRVNPLLWKIKIYMPIGSHEIFEALFRKERKNAINYYFIHKDTSKAIINNKIVHGTFKISKDIYSKKSILTLEYPQYPLSIESARRNKIKEVRRKQWRQRLKEKSEYKKKKYKNLSF